MLLGGKNRWCNIYRWQWILDILGGAEMVEWKLVSGFAGCIIEILSLGV